MARSSGRPAQEAAVGAAAPCSQDREAEIEAAFGWYLDRSPAAAEAFLAAVDQAMALIEAAPERQPIIRGRLRRVLLRRFPYGVYYKVFPSTVSVVGVIYGHRHPDTWVRRAAP